MPEVLRITSVEQLYILLDAILEAKFHAMPNDNDIYGSLIVNDIAQRIINALIACGESRERLEQKLSLERYSKVWDYSIERICTRSKQYWKNLTIDKKREYAHMLFCPLIISDDRLTEFVQQVEEALTTNSW